MADEEEIVSLSPDFWGWTEAELLADLKTAQKELAGGKMRIHAGSGDVQATMQAMNNARERIRAFEAALYTFYLQDNDGYSQYAGMSLAGSNVARAVFSTS